MQTVRIGIVYPGQMGSFVAASAANSGQDVCWASEGRSQRSRERAAKFNLTDLDTLAALCDACAMIFCVCPPHAAEEMAARILDCGFTGLYLDANAISPRRLQGIARKMTAAGVRFVDGGIVGLPIWDSSGTVLYLSGPGADTVAGCFTAGPLQAKVIGDQPGKASALKMCYAARTKGTTALLCAVTAAAESLGVSEELHRQWSDEDPALTDKILQSIRRVTAKAWRFHGEMDEISSTFEAAGLPGEFHAAAAEIYRRISEFKDAPATPPLAEVLAALIKK